ncbi:MAG: divergent polysaccharide deacetylase family protein [Gammaproteobacteria bacterium]|nr:divergent polysaccharide deacetylase family protein [Gammaproteobacteria bacterium]
MRRKGTIHGIARAGLLAALLTMVHSAWAERPRLAVVIDDIGWDLGTGRRVLSLPGALTLAVLPGTPAGSQLALEAHNTGREVILHQPMTAELGLDAGPGNLIPDMAPDAIAALLAANLAQVPHHSGVSNHMGSLLTRCEASMSALMTELSWRGLYFLDSRTTPRTVALRKALEASVPATRRDVFLDTVLDSATIEHALESAVRLAEQRGQAVAIGHPHSVTLDVLEAQLPRILNRVELVPVSALVTLEPRPEPGQSAGE